MTTFAKEMTFSYFSIKWDIKWDFSVSYRPVGGWIDRALMCFLLSFLSFQVQY